MATKLRSPFIWLADILILILPLNWSRLIYWRNVGKWRHYLFSDLVFSLPVGYDSLHLKRDLIFWYICSRSSWAEVSSWALCPLGHRYHFNPVCSAANELLQEISIKDGNTLLIWHQYRWYKEWTMNTCHHQPAIVKVSSYVFRNYFRYALSNVKLK